MLHALDVPGVVLFGAALAGGLTFLLEVSDGAPWLLLPPVALLAAVLVWRERRAATPFLSLDLVANRRVLSVLGQYAVVNLIFYAAFFGVPQWLEEVRGFAPQAGLLLLPLAGLSVVMMPVAARVVAARGWLVASLVGAAGLFAGPLLVLLMVDEGTALVAVVAVVAVLGVPGAFNNLALQTGLYERSPRERTGAAGGLFQTARYLGAISATALLGLAFGVAASTEGLHEVAAVAAVVGLLLLASGVRRVATGAARRP